MSKFCSNCGSSIQGNMSFCYECGTPVIHNVKSFSPGYYQDGRQVDRTGIGAATVSVVFGSLGFYPLILIGSIVGLITSLVAISRGAPGSAARGKVGLGLSIGSAALWITIISIIIISDL